MSNPAPTLNQINAFNATQGTTIDFNIIGGTEVIRSNKIYIYDLSDNSLICTHLYVSTESIHELPPNTSSSIVYASGKSSADFTNNTQYYAQIQTFTDTSGTQGASGLSVAKLFWCLPTPTLTLSTIPTTISTTSYNVSATYTPNTSGSATNEIQEFQFNLYSAIGALLQTSGVVLYGDGVDLSYNFSGLEVDSTYYVTLDVTTTQGMNVSVQSNTFTVSIDTPTMGSASVVNNGCDGYISVTSNLSSEYEHEESAEAGEIMSFTTDSVNDITELDVDFEPVQDGTPWMSAQDTEPYMFRPVPTQTEDFGHESDTIVGGTVGNNQLVTKAIGSTTAYNLTLDRSADEHSVRIHGTANQSGNIILCGNTISGKANHVYIGNMNTPSVSGAFINFGGVGSVGQVAQLRKPTSDGNLSFYLAVSNNTSIDMTITPTVIDLTAYFGSTIADYVYTLEQGTAGVGIAWLKENAPQLFEYHAYDAGSLESVSGLASHDMVGFNQFDKSTSTAGKRFGSSGMVLVDRATGSVSDYIRVLPNIVYYAKNVSGSAQGNTIVFYDADKSWIGTVDIGTYTSESGTFTTPNNCAYIRFQYETVNENTVCINISNASLNGTYKPYTKHSYPLDSTLTLRGIPKLDNGNLYYDGDTYESDGTVTRKYGIVTFDGSSDENISAGTSGYPFRILLPQDSTTQSVTTEYTNTFANYLTEVRQADTWGVAMTFSRANGQRYLYFKITDSMTDISELRTYLANHPLVVVYELATPTTETADPYTNPQIVDPSGTEEYVGSPIPVGHETTYQRICPITGWTGCEVDVSGVNLIDSALEQGTFTNSGVESASVKRIRTGFIRVKQGDVTISTPTANTYIHEVYCYDKNKDFVSRLSGGIGASSGTVTVPNGAQYVRFSMRHADDSNITPTDATAQLELGSTATTYTPYNGTTYNITWQTEAGTVYGGKLNLVTGVLTVMGAKDTYDQQASIGMDSDLGGYHRFYISNDNIKKYTDYTSHMKTNLCPIVNNYAYYGGFDGEMAVTAYSITSNPSNYVYIISKTISSVADLKTFLTSNPLEVWYELATPIAISLTPQQMQTLSGQNNIWSNTNGGMYLVYQLPITSLLVKRRDVADVSGKWLTLYSIPITQASDMDFTFIDFLNQYGKTYQYALVPVLAQDQSGVVVQIEGGYTVSDNVDSIFDGVYIADQTNVERVKAGVGYGNIDMNQGVGSITPIGSKYPIVITNSQNQYHNGSIRGTIVPNDFYSNGNLSRIDMVNKRDELEQFLTNKRAKIIKDWNGKMWLVMIMSNVACSFDDNYGMGMVSFSADWLEVGDPTNQQDLYNAGLINVGGV